MSISLESISTYVTYIIGGDFSDSRRKSFGSKGLRQKRGAIFGPLSTPILQVLEIISVGIALYFWLLLLHPK